MHPLRRAAESVLPHVLPGPLAAAILAAGDRYGQFRRYRNSDLPAATRRFESEFGLRVRRGPFCGMRYSREASRSRHAIPKLLGSYEEELHPYLASMIADPSYRRFVDIGSAEGYYTTGFAFATGKPVIAFEVEPLERRHTRAMARLNGVEALVSVRSWCSPEKLQTLCPDRSLILADCEGYETSLFTPSLIPHLRQSDLVVELHDRADVGATRAMLDHFSENHDIELVAARSRSAVAYPELASLDLENDRFASEYRLPGQQWAVITARRP
jgi:hypothetical protein